MTVRRISAVVLLAALVAGAGCGERAGAPLPAEMDEALYVQGMQLKRQGRHQEALGPFLKVIEKRGSRGAAESHLEAGVIYLQHVKDPVEAYHHFRRYLDLEPKSKQADFVRGQVQAALREFAKSIPGRPLEAQTARLEMDDELIRLRRENDGLRAELATVRNAAIAPLPRAAGVITMPDDLRAVAPPVQVPAPEAPAAAQPRREAEAVAKAAPPRGSGRTHTVKAGESLFRIGQRYGVKADAIAAANRDLLPAGAGSTLRPGMELKIP
ncbi:MAG: LysM peptidoglycan-binding domain-containing protein [Opitutaceae bacterium]|nr:LysM peptidoglycan-binding domain-containing protein [Opitutaceae bacterium]